MNKVFGNKGDFAYVKDDGSRMVIGYDLQPADGDNEHYTWNEVYIYKKQHNLISLEEVRQAVLDDINRQTDERILSGFVWTPSSGESEISVWLSKEFQFNVKAAYDLAVQTQGKSLPTTFKLGETSGQRPVYHTFKTLNELADFYTKAMAYINQCLVDGWRQKDGIDFSFYEQTGNGGSSSDDNGGNGSGENGGDNGGGNPSSGGVENEE